MAYTLFSGKYPPTGHERWISFWGTSHTNSSLLGHFSIVSMGDTHVLGSDIAHIQLEPSFSENNRTEKSLKPQFYRI